MTSVTQKCEFECMYFFLDDRGYVCLNPRRYRLEVTVDSPDRSHQNGYVLAFADLHRYMVKCVPHDAFVYNTTPTTLTKINQEFKKIITPTPIKIFEMDQPVCAETLLTAIIQRLQTMLNSSEPGVVITDAKLYENSNSYVSYKASSL